MFSPRRQGVARFSSNRGRFPGAGVVVAALAERGRAVNDRAYNNAPESARVSFSPASRKAAVAVALAVACLAGAARGDTASAVTGSAATTQVDALASVPVLPALSANPGPALDPRFVAQASEATPAAPASPQSAGTWGALGGAWQSPTLLGDMGGLRPALAKYGITLQLYEEAETFGNPTGGVRQGFEVNGVTTAQLQWDPKPLLGVDGGIFSVSGFHIWGGDLSAANLLNLQTVSSLETNASIRLWELWYQQNFGARFDVKIGEQSLDNEFMMSQNAAYFLNSVMGWPMLPSANLPGGGPVYPLAGLGVRARARPSDAVTIMAGVFNGSPIPLNSPNTPLSNPNGLSFPLNTGVLAIAELQYTFPAATPSGKPAKPEARCRARTRSAHGTTARISRARSTTRRASRSQAPPATEMPAQKQGNYAIYAVADQTIWRGSDGSRNVSAFVRPMFTTLQDRNLISFSVNAGLTLHQPFAGRDNDVLGLGFGVARVSDGVANSDRDFRVFQPTVATPVRGTETFVEATYQAQILPSWQLQPDVQYVINPGAGLANPYAPTQSIRNEFVIGLRANLTF